MLSDRFGREVTEVRVSLTDRCNFDCVYCHNEGLGDTRGPMASQDHEMTTDEVVRFLDVATEFDIEAVKFTGGEPMLREDLEEIVRRTPNAMEPSLTTNGSLLPGRAEELAEAGLERVNVSQDAVDPEAFAEITKSGAYDAVIDGVRAALGAGLNPVKLNMVVFEATAGYVPNLVDMVTENRGLSLQLIEYMPEIAGNPQWAVDMDRVHEWLADRADRIETRQMHHRSRYWIENNAPTDTELISSQESAGGLIEIVDPVENPEFCANCHRIRVTPDGHLTGCLNRHDDTHSMGDMSREEIRKAVRKTARERVPYYGEYVVETEDGEWTRNERYS
jgi:cyclic pyranopterin phosphate synthase